MGQYTTFIEEIAKTAKFRGANMLDFADSGQEMYISFQTLLKFLDDYVNLESNFSTQGTGGKSIIKIDWESAKPFFAYSTSVSFNLLNCYLYNDKVSTGTGDPGTSDGQFSQDGVFTFYPFTEFPTDTNEAGISTIIDAQSNLTGSEYLKSIQDVFEQSATPKNFSVYPTIGNINYIYLNCGMIAKAIVKGSENPDNIISIRQFLQEICDNVGKALGSINDFQVIVDDETNTLTIVDFNQKRIPGLTKVKNTPTTVISAQGLGSFAINISAESNITPELATTIAIGAQVNGNQVGYEATTFSRLSAGLSDRIYANKKVKDTETPNEGTKLLEEKYQQLLEVEKAYITIIANQKETNGSAITFTSAEPLNLENTCVEFYKALQGAYTQDNQLQPTFIPVKLELTLLGISGMKIFQRFRLSSDILPLSYKDQFDFIITGLSHQVDSSNKWTTKISALTVLREN